MILRGRARESGYSFELRTSPIERAPLSSISHFHDFVIGRTMSRRSIRCVSISTKSLDSTRHLSRPNLGLLSVGQMPLPFVVRMGASIAMAGREFVVVVGRSRNFTFGLQRFEESESRYQ